MIPTLNYHYRDDELGALADTRDPQALEEAAAVFIRGDDINETLMAGYQLGLLARHSSGVQIITLKMGGKLGAQIPCTYCFLGTEEDVRNLLLHLPSASA